MSRVRCRGVRPAWITLAATATATAIALAGCGESGSGPLAALAGKAPPATVDVQLAHPNGVVLQVASIQARPTETVVGVQILNGRERETELNRFGFDDRGYLLTDAGTKLPLVLPAANRTLAVPGRQSLDGLLVFAGELPRGESATLVLNDSLGLDAPSSAHGKFQLALPLADAFGSDGVARSTTVLSNLRANPVSRLRMITGSASGLAAAAPATSELRSVEALKTELGAVESERGTVVSLPGDVTFEFDKADIRAEARALLDSLVELVASVPDGRITIEGHTDAKGDDAYNKRLSEARADAVRDHLVQAGVPAARLGTIGLGELRPAAPNINADGSDDEAGRQRNRRVEVILPNAAPAVGAQPQPAPRSD